jgi:hypothetical protein
VQPGDVGGFFQHRAAIFRLGRNQRADAAERSSAAANAQADAMRNAPPPVVAPTTTTVELTQHDEPAPMSHTPVHHLHHKVVHHAKHPAPVKTTTTATVTTTHN